MSLQRQTMTVELADGRVLDVEAINPDYIRIERKLPTLGMTPDPRELGSLTYMTSVAWACLVRTKDYDGDLMQFLNNDCVVCDVHKPPADAVDDGQPFGDPTQPAAVTGSP